VMVWRRYHRKVNTYFADPCYSYQAYPS
jgi:hypothetical protein